jgi:hypothetical protein
MNQGRRPGQGRDAYFIFACCAIISAVIIILAVALPRFDWLC